MRGCNQSVAFRKMRKVVKLWSKNAEMCKIVLEKNAETRQNGCTKNAETDDSLRKEVIKSTEEISHVFKDINKETDTKRRRGAA